jgi:hypothetical protein
MLRNQQEMKPYIFQQRKMTLEIFLPILHQQISSLFYLSFDNILYTLTKRLQLLKMLEQSAQLLSPVACTDETQRT